MPAAQSKQEEAPVSGRYEPALHCAQLDKPVVAAMRPAVQSVQLFAVDAEYLPKEHASQLELDETAE